MEQALTRAWLHRGVLAWLLSPLALLMWVLVMGRRLAFRAGWLHRERLPVPVVVVGNRIAGGAGKTPTTLALLAHLQARGWRPGVLTRGYGANLSPLAFELADSTLPSTAEPRCRLLDARTAAHLSTRQTGDEPMLIWRRTGVPLMIGRDRAASGRALLAAHPEIDILVCDDGLQHLRLARDVEIVVFDERGAGNGMVLPAGPLREPVGVGPMSLDGQAALVLYNADRPSTKLTGHVARRGLAPLQSLAAWQAASNTLPSAAIQANMAGVAAMPQEPLRAPPRDQPLTALAGIAQPERFFQALRAQGWPVQGIPLADHDDWATLPWPPEARHVVVTEKDAVKLDLARLQRERPQTTVWVAALHFEPDPAFWAALDSRLPAPPTSA
ncbi:MAG: hypothetical protein RI920_2181 [Pseudomonadota bacterium]